MYVDKCVFFDGFHVYPDSDCPHTRQSDEEGPVVPTGWTVQAGPQPVERHQNGQGNSD